MSIVIFALILFASGSSYVFFAYRDPPPAIEHWFRIPAIFAFFPEHDRVRAGRLTVGALLLLAAVMTLAREAYQQLHWLLRS
jgi:hypothetical protein